MTKKNNRSKNIRGLVITILMVLGYLFLQYKIQESNYNRGRADGERIIVDQFQNYLKECDQVIVVGADENGLLTGCVTVQRERGGVQVKPI